MRCPWVRSRGDYTATDPRPRWEAAAGPRPGAPLGRRLGRLLARGRPRGVVAVVVADEEGLRGEDDRVRPPRREPGGRGRDPVVGGVLVRRGRGLEVEVEGHGRAVDVGGVEVAGCCRI